MAFKNISFPMLVGAVVVGLLAAFLSVVYLKYKERELEARLRGPDTQKIQIVVASTDLPKGTILGSNNLAVRPIPIEFVHPSAITPETFDSIEGKLLVQPLAKGRSLLKDFVEGGKARDFSDTLADGRRAITIQVDELNSIGGHARPGNKVDIYAKLPGALKTAGLVQQGGNVLQAAQAAAASLGKMVVPVLQNVQVLATGPSAYGEFAEKYSRESLNRSAQQTANYSTLTLNVTPAQAALLTQAEEYGDLVTLLRNRDDRSKAGFAEMSPLSLFENAQRMKLASKKVDITGLKKTKDGFYVTEDGKVVTESGDVLEGVTLNKDGEVVTASGKVLKADEIIVKSDGTVTTSSGEVIAGISTAIETAEELLGLSSSVSTIEFLSGGNSKDGVAIPGILPVIGETVEGAEK